MTSTVLGGVARAKTVSLRRQYVLLGMLLIAPTILVIVYPLISAIYLSPFSRPRAVIMTTGASSTSGGTDLVRGQRELKDGTLGHIRSRPQPSLMRFDDRAADR